MAEVQPPAAVVEDVEAVRPRERLKLEPQQVELPGGVAKAAQPRRPTAAVAVAQGIVRSALRSGGKVLIPRSLPEWRRST